MRFYWGLGVGHVYSHQNQTVDDSMEMEAEAEDGAEEEAEEESEAPLECHNVPMDTENLGEAEDSDNGEDDSQAGSALGMEDRENDNWMDEDSDPNEGDIEEEEGDAEFLERYDMYGL